jgi:TolA-binding protein
MGIDGAYSGMYRPLDTVMQEAVGKRVAAIRALEIKDEEIEGLTSVAARFYGTNVGLDAVLKKADALAYHGRADEAASLLSSVVTQYPKSVWAVRALMRLAGIHGATPQAADAWGRVISSWPQSLFWIEAKMGLSGTFLAMAEAEKEEGRRIELRTRAGNVCREIITAFPSCPEGSRAREFLASRGL